MLIVTIISLVVSVGAVILILLLYSENKNIRNDVSRFEQLLRDELPRNREEMSRNLSSATDSTLKAVNDISANQFRQLSEISQKNTLLIDSNRELLEKMRLTIEEKLLLLQKDNSEKLEKMRHTVDEKLQSTLEKRLGDSFKLVSERLEQVYKGLGEMQNLATGVGDLKRVLTNVKSRGTWGEVQLEAMLSEILTPEQFVTNFSSKSNSDRVEFAIRMPGRESNEPIYLPIDAKFPIEDYKRILDAQELGDKEAIESANKQLDRSLNNCAKDISEKYLNPPITTDFAILYLPTEGLFAEVIRRPDLCDTLQRKYRIVVAGPTTLWSLLSSLQMGFRTLAIEKRSSEVWTTLEAVKSEWLKYADSLEDVKKKLQTASNSIDSAQTRVRVIGRKLKDVQELEAQHSPEEILGLNQ